MQEEFKDIVIKYLYVKSFTWHQTIDRELYLGHPLPGRVYRDIFNPTSLNHKLFLPNRDGALGHTFKALIEDNPNYTSEFIEITIDNILDLNILEEDLDAMIKWMTDDVDVKAIYEPQDQGLHRLQQALHQSGQDEAEALAMGTDAILHLWHVNPLKFDIVVNLMNYLAEADLNSYADIANHIRHHPTSGKGVNIAQALRALDNYNSDNRRVNEDLADLYVAIEAIVTEIERKVELDQID